MALAICASLAAVYLTVEARMNGNEELANAFRVRAFIAEAFVGVFALLGLFLSSFEAPLLWQGMLSHALWAVGVTGILGAALIGALLYRRYKIARILVIMEVGALLGTWGLAQLPYIVPPDLTIPGSSESSNNAVGIPGECGSRHVDSSAFALVPLPCLQRAIILYRLFMKKKSREHEE